jgi:general secretion pathway protein L
MLSATIGQVRTFFEWWGRELTGMLPAWLRESGKRAGLAHIVAFDDDGFRLLDAKSVSKRTDGGTDGPSQRGGTLSPPQILSQLRETQRGQSALAIGLRIPLSFCFSRVVELPSSAAEDFSRLMILDMERATPFRSSDVFSAFVVMARASGQSAKTTLRQFIVKRALLSGVISQLETAGLHVEHIDCWDETGIAPIELDFRAEETTQLLSHRSLARPIMAASLISVLLAGYAAYSYLGRMQEALTKLETQTNELRAASASKREAKKAARAAQATLAALETLSGTTVPKLAVVDELSRLLPDSAWVSDARLSNGGADINGFAASAVALLPLLEKSPLFVDANSSSAVTFDTREDKERFSIHVRYRPSGVMGKPTGEGSE